MILTNTEITNIYHDYLVTLGYGNTVFIKY